MPRHPLMELTLARFREFVREPEALFWTFAFPVILAIGLGVAFRSRPPADFQAALVGDGEAAEVVSGILSRASGVDVRRARADEAARWIRTGKVDVVVVVVSGPTGAPSISYRYDPRRTEGRAARLAVDDAIQAGLGAVDAAPVTDEEITAAGSRYIDFLIPGLIGLNVMGSSLWGLGYSLVFARKRKLLKRLAATPMRRSHFLLSYVISRVALLVVEVAALVAFGRVVFGVGAGCSFASVAAVSLAGGLAFTGIALVVASRPDSTEVASGWMNAVQLPMWLLSGSFFSYERFPEVVHPFIRILPLTAFNDAMRAVMNEGGWVGSVLPELAILCLTGLLGFAVSLRFFRWQ